MIFRINAKHSLLRTLTACMAIVLFLTPSIQSVAFAEADRVRVISVEPIGFRIDVPATWQLELNEKLRGVALLKIRGTTRDGRPLPASLSVIYSEPEPTKTYPQLPEPETYAALFSRHLTSAGNDFELLRSEKYDIDGHAGVLVEYTVLIEEQLQRIVQINVVPPDGTKRFIVTYGTFEEHADVDLPFLKGISETIRLTAQDGQKPER